jgi:hypothetical protein
LDVGSLPVSKLGAAAVKFSGEQFSKPFAAIWPAGRSAARRASLILKTSGQLQMANNVAVPFGFFCVGCPALLQVFTK